MQGFARVAFGVFPEGDQTGQRRDQRSHTANVHTKQKLPVIVRELGKQNGRGHIADHLAGGHAEDQSAFFQKHGEKLPHRLKPRHVACEDEEEHKGQQQRIVHGLQSLPVCEDQHRRNDDQTHLVGDATEHNGDGQQKQQQVQHRPLHRQTDRLIGHGQRIRLHEDQTAHRDQRHRDHKGQRHDRHKFSGGDLKKGIKIQVLGIAEGSEHAAQVGSDVLHDVGEGHVVLFVGGAEYEITQRQKGQQRHIVGDQHGADEGDVHQHQNGQPCIAKHIKPSEDDTIANMVVTPKNIDIAIDRIAEVVASGFNLAVHRGFGRHEINEYLI